MPRTPLTPDEADIKLLRDAAKKIRNCAIPHVISEDRWTGRSADQVKGIVYDNRHVFDLVSNVQGAVRWFTKKDKGLRSMVLERSEKKSPLAGLWMQLRLAKISMTRLERNLPDAEVDGNLIHWMEHSIHIALWSPVVTESVAVFLEAEADAREQGVVSPSSAAAVAMAKEIKKKKVWDNTIQTEIPKRTLVADLANLIPARRTEAVRRMKYMRDQKVDPTVARALYEAYGHQSPQIARKNAERMLQRAEKAVASGSVKAADKKVWRARVKACQVFIASLDT